MAFEGWGESGTFDDDPESLKSESLKIRKSSTENNSEINSNVEPGRNTKEKLISKKLNNYSIEGVKTKLKKNSPKKKLKGKKSKLIKEPMNSRKRPKKSNKDRTSSPSKTKQSFQLEKTSRFIIVKKQIQILSILIVVSIILAIIFGFLYYIYSDINNNNSGDSSHDSDSDGLSDEWEKKHNLNPNNADTDFDGNPDGWEDRYALDPLLDDSAEDYDQDGFDINNNGKLEFAERFTNLDEYIYGTDPRNPDTDGDQMWDGWEVHYREKCEKLKNYFWISDQPKKMDPTNPSDANDDIDFVAKSGDENIIGRMLKPDKLTNQQEFLNGTDPTSPDTDGDSLSDYEELILYNTNPLALDTDNDKLWDGWEVRYGGWNFDLDPNKLDSDGDGINDTQEDYDNDSLWNLLEWSIGTSPISNDTDGDGLTDDWEENYWMLELMKGTDPVKADSDKDYDGDGLSNLEEFQRNTIPINSDTDNDGLSDGEEVLIGFPGLLSNGSYKSNSNLPRYFTNPTTNDTDSDGIFDGEEVEDGDDNYITNATSKDSDNDGIEDLEEILKGIDSFETDPTNEDSDSDWLTDKEEIDAYWGWGEFKGYKTLPIVSDTDGDGISDGVEVKTDFHPFTDFNSTIYNCLEFGPIDGTDPTNPDTDGDSLPDGWEMDWGYATKTGQLGDIKDFDWYYGHTRYGFNYTDKLANNPQITGVWLINPLDHRDKFDNVDSDGFDENNDGAINNDEEFNNFEEFSFWKSNPLSEHSDEDGIPDGWEDYYGREARLLGITGPNPTVNDGDLDSDKDGIQYYINNIKYTDPFTNSEEYEFGTNPIKYESVYHDIWYGDDDGDGLLNGWERIFNGMTSNVGGYAPKNSKPGFFDPTKKDSDNDGELDGEEDYDNDGYNNTFEQFIYGDIDIDELEHGPRGSSDPTDSEITPESVVKKTKGYSHSRGATSLSTQDNIVRLNHYLSIEFFNLELALKKLYGFQQWYLINNNFYWAKSTSIPRWLYLV